MATQVESLVVELDAKTEKYLRKMSAVNRKNKAVNTSTKLLNNSLGKFKASLAKVDAQLCTHAKKLDLTNRKSRKNARSTKELSSENRKLRRSVIGLNKNVGTLTNKLGSLDTRTIRTAKSTQVLTTTNRGFNLSLVAGAVSLALVTRSVISYADSFTSMTNKLKIATNGQDDLVKTTKAMFDISEETFTSVITTTNLFTRMERATRKLDISQARLLKITGSINKAFAISGATTAETTGAIRQLTQAFALGALRGDELNSVSEQAPVIMEAVQEATGKTSGELRKLAETGAITAEILIESLERYANKIDIDFAQSTRTFAQKLEFASNNALEFVGANLAINDAVDTAGDAIVGLSNNIDTLVVIAEIAAAVFIGRMVASFKLMSIESLKATITMNAMGQVIKKTTVATNALALSARVARGALAALGGPVGILITAATSLALFVDFESDTEKQLIKTNKQIDSQISSLGSLNKAQVEAANKDFQRQQKNNFASITQVNTALAEAEKKQKSLADQSRQSTIEFSLNSREIALLKEELQGLFKEQENIQKLGAGIFKIQFETEQKGRRQEKGLIDVEGQAQERRDKRAEERRLEAEAKSRKRQLDAIAQRQEDFDAESETQVEALEKRLLRETELINESENSKLLNEVEAAEKRGALQDEFQLRLMDLAQTDLERIIERTELELEEQRRLLELKLINEEEFQLKSKAIADKGVLDRIEAAKKKAVAESGLENTTLKVGIEALDEFGKENEKAARAAFEIKKIQKLSEAIVSLPAAVTEALPNIPLAIATGALGVAQIATIAGSSFGGGGGGGGISAPSVAESTPTAEPAQPETTTLDISEAGTGGSQTMRLIIETADGESFLDGLAESITERTRQGR